MLALEAEREIDYDFVAREAGDITMSDGERARHEEERRRRGVKLYSDLLFILAHRRYPAQRARELWTGILHHRQTLDRALGRPSGICVAALDYLVNVVGEIDRPTVVDEPCIIAMAEMATKDWMTQLFDRGAFQLALHRELKRSNRYGLPVSLLILDVDDFKGYNDTRGHQAGDRVLRRIGRTIDSMIRDLDIGARYGGDEFAVIATSTDNLSGVALAERIRHAVAEDLRSDGVTISAGVATCPDDSATGDLLIRAADAALYDAKEHGRNRTRACTDKPRKSDGTLQFSPSEARPGRPPLEFVRERAGAGTTR